MGSTRQVAEYLLIALVTALVTASIIAWGLDAIGEFPFSAIATVIAVNNFVAAAVIGPILLYFFYEPAARVGMTYPSVLDDDDLPETPGERRRLAAWGIAVVSVAWFLLGFLVSLALEGVPLEALFRVGVRIGTPGSPIQIALGAVGMAALLGLAAVSGERLSEIHRADRE